MMRHAVVQKMKTAALKEYAANHSKPQVKYLPLPNIGHEYADGRIRRAVLAEEIEGLPVHRVSELILIDQQTGKEVARAVRETESDSVFDRYLKSSKTKITVTPAVLDGFDEVRGKLNEKKHQNLVRKLFAAYDVASITELPAGALRAKGKHGHDKRRHVSLVVEFRNDVGLLAVGAGRNAGMGIFANLR
jgi:CRISPR-associated protein Csb2